MAQRYYAVCFTDDLNEWCVDTEKMFRYKQQIIKTNSRDEAVQRAYSNLKSEETDSSKWMLCGVVDVTEEVLSGKSKDMAHII